MKFNMASSNISIDSVDSDVFFVEQLSNKPSPQRNNSPKFLNSAELSETYTTEMPTVFLIASPEPQIVTFNDDSNEPTMPNGFGRQFPIIPPSLIDLNLPPNPFNIVATMAVVNHEHGNNYSPQSPELSEPSPISTNPMNVSTFENWETTHKTTDDNTFYSSDEPKRIHFLPSSPSPTSSHPRKMKKNWSWECPFQKMGVSQLVSEACGQNISSTKDITGPSTKNLNFEVTTNTFIRILGP